MAARMKRNSPKTVTILAAMTLAMAISAPADRVVQRASAAAQPDMSFKDPGNNLDPYINFVRVPGSYPGVYNYSVHYFPCEIDGGTDFVGSIKYEFKLHNGDGNSQGVPYGPVLYSYIGKYNCAQSEVRPLIADTPTLFCCGTAIMTVVNGTDTDPNNNQANDNELYVAMNPAHTRVVPANVLNWRGAQRNFAFSVDQATVPSGWAVVPSPSSLEVPALTEGFFNISVTAPSEVSVWPTIDVWATTGSDPGVDQSTRIRVLNAAFWEDDDPCA